MFSSVRAGLTRRPAYWISVVQSLLGRTIGLFRLASNTVERSSVAGFILKWSLCNILPRELRPKDAVLVLNGCRYKVAPRRGESDTFREIYLRNAYEGLPDFIPGDGWIVFDIGANIGVFSVRQARRGAHVYAFEPNPDCFQRLSWTLADNGLSSKVTAFKCAIGATHQLGFLTGAKTSVMGRVAPVPAAADGAGVVVTVDSLDGVVKRLGLVRIDLLKIDVEGGELEVLRGATQVLPLVNRIVLEYHSGQLLEQVTTHLRRFRFKQRSIKPAGPTQGVVYWERGPVPSESVAAPA
jgi:FkbM family methyltransferase